ncbi:MAG: hypothetical protein AAB403_01825 [Planctomycetota bacterium]
MPAKTFEIALAGFTFPAGLHNNRANFRFVADVRYTNKDGNFATENVVMPSLDTFWECDTGRVGSPNYVRDAGGGPSFDMNKIDDWDRLVLRFRGEMLHSVQFKVFDVNRKDAWDSIKDILGGIVSAILGKVKGLLPGALGPAAFLSDSLGNGASDLESYLLKKIAGGGDKVLARGSVKLDLDQPGAHNRAITMPGQDGQYTIALDVLV